MSVPRDPERPPGAPAPSASARVESWSRKGLETVTSLLGGDRPLELMTAIALLGGGLLITADFLDLFRIEAGGLTVEEQPGGEQHSYAVLVVGLGVIGATLLARSTRQWPPAGAVIVLALIALGIVLVGDLPEATRSDLVRGARIADASPAAGFWVELVGAAMALASGLAMAYLLRARE